MSCEILDMLRVCVWYCFLLSVYSSTVCVVETHPRQVDYQNRKKRNLNRKTAAEQSGR